MAFAERLKELRKSHDLTQQKAADALGISNNSYQRYEYGEREPVISVAEQIANYYAVSLDYLVGRSDNPKRS